MNVNLYICDGKREVNKYILPLGFLRKLTALMEKQHGIRIYQYSNYSWDIKIFDCDFKTCDSDGYSLLFKIRND